jgi:hypothetical protein
MHGNSDDYAAAPAIPVSIAKTAQTASISSTNLVAARNSTGFATTNILVQFCVAAQTTTAGSAGTLDVSVIYTDIRGTSTTDKLVNALDLTTAGAHAGTCTAVTAQDTVAIQYSTTVTGASGSTLSSCQRSARITDVTGIDAK